MKRSRFSEEQIIAILKEHEAGMPTRLLRVGLYSKSVTFQGSTSTPTT